MSTPKIPFNKPRLAGRELEYIQAAVSHMHLSGNGPFTEKCQHWLRHQTGTSKALLTHSATGALEIAALLCQLEPGDEVIMPSYTFVSTANAFVLRGAVPVFVDIRPDTLNLDESLIEAAITDRTKAICVVHYGGVSCEMDTIMRLASRYGLFVLEDAAQALDCKYRGRPLGAIGDASAISFHETKNIISGEGGALLVNRKDWSERATVLWEKGTNRSRFISGHVDKYTWVDIGSSFLPGEIVAAFLWGQLQEALVLNDDRRKTWQLYHEHMSPCAERWGLQLPFVPEECEHSAHLYFVILPDRDSRPAFIQGMQEYGVHVVFHYIPLHDSPAGQRFARCAGPLPVTENLAARLVRLPMWIGMSEEECLHVISAVDMTLKSISSTDRV